MCHTRFEFMQSWLAKTGQFVDWLIAEINDLNTFTTRVEKLWTDVGSESSDPPLLLWLKAD